MPEGQEAPSIKAQPGFTKFWRHSVVIRQRRRRGTKEGGKYEYEHFSKILESRGTGTIFECPENLDLRPNSHSEAGPNSTLGCKGPSGIEVEPVDNAEYESYLEDHG